MTKYNNIDNKSALKEQAEITQAERKKEFLPVNSSKFTDQKEGCRVN